MTNSHGNSARAGLLAACLTLAATGATAQSAIVGFFSNACTSVDDLTAPPHQAELFVFRIAPASPVPDMLFDARASGGARVEAFVDANGYSVDPNWSGTP